MYAGCRYGYSYWLNSCHGKRIKTKIKQAHRSFNGLSLDDLVNHINSRAIIGIIIAGHIIANYVVRYQTSEKEADVPGCKIDEEILIHYQCIGKGENPVLIHGLGANLAF